MHLMPANATLRDRTLCGRPLARLDGPLEWAVYDGSWSHAQASRIVRDRDLCLACEVRSTGLSGAPADDEVPL